MNMNTNKELDIFYFSSTHWDREWYQDFQGFRYRLVRLVDNLLKLFKEDKDYKTFHFDGQTIVLEDYLEIAPERRGELKEQIEKGNILIGPWYVMPDEFLVSGESLIKNLMKGHSIAKKWGVEPWKYGYVCDIFGHIAQMPQIFNGFSIKYSLLGRGTSETDPTYFKWRSPDGSECLNFKLEPKMGYGSFRLSFYAGLEDPSADNPETLKRLKEYVDSEIERSKLPIVILMDGNDHSEASVNTSGYIKALRELYPNARVHHVNLCSQGELLEKYSDKLPVICGELNRTAMKQNGYLHLITNTLSSYYPIKKENDECQSLLEKTIEPMEVFSMFEGNPKRHSYTNLAYEYLLKNQPHDSICGCSIDRVHKDMEYRFSQVKEICTALKEDYLFTNSRKCPEDFGGILTLYNMLPFELNKTVSVDLYFKENSPFIYAEPFGYERINSFKIFDSDGNEIPYKVTEVKRGYRKRIIDQICKAFDLHKVTMQVKIPPCGSVEYKIVPQEGPVRYMQNMKSGTNYAENSFIRLTVLEDGTLEIFDKKTGKTYSKLCNIADNGEIGDGWYHAAPVNDSTVYPFSGCSVTKTECGPKRCVFKVSRYMDVPKEMIFGESEKHRSCETVRLNFDMHVGLSENSRYADIKLEYNNQAKDHRVRLIMPTNVEGETYFAGQAFYCCERKVGINYETQNYRETDQFEKATNGIVGKRDKDGNGIAFVSKAGLHECAAFDDDEATLAVTLSRSFKTTVMTNGETRCQINGPLSYEFSLAPLDEDVTYSDLLRLKDEMEYDILSSFVPCGESEKAKAPHSHMKVEGKGISTSCIKRAETGNENEIIVRVFNSSAEQASGKISFEKEIVAASEVNLNEEHIKDISFNPNEININLAPWKIATYRIELKRG